MRKWRNKKQRHKKSPDSFYCQIRIRLQPTIQNSFSERLQYKTLTPRQVFCKKVIPKSFAKFTGKHLWQSLFISRDFIKNYSSSGVFLQNLQIFSGHLSCRTSENGCFLRGFFLEVFQNFQTHFKSINQKMLLVYIVHTTILKVSSHKQFN